MVDFRDEWTAAKKWFLGLSATAAFAIGFVLGALLF